MEPRACWAPLPIRPQMARGVVREYLYAYASLSPQDGALDWWIGPQLNAARVGEYLAFLSAQHAREEVALVWDGASAHRSQELVVPANIHLIRLPPYSPRLNPVEAFWAELREKFFHNKTFGSLVELEQYLREKLAIIQERVAELRRLTLYNWIEEALTNVSS